MGALLSEPVTAMVVERASTPAWTASIATMQGWRRTHEDAHIFKACQTGNEESGAFAVLDGHGGSAAAIESAKMLEERLLALAERGTLPANAAAAELKEAFLSVDASLREKLGPGDTSGTTVVGALVTRPSSEEYCIQVAHAGDSRAVVRVGSRLVCSSDHKPERTDEHERILAAGGTVEQGALGGGPMRVDGSLAVSRGLGDFQFKPEKEDQELCKVTAVPEVTTVADCSPGDWMVLACDGIFDVITNEELRDFIDERLEKAAPERAEGGAIMVELLNLCLEKGSKDNCTACLVQLLPSDSVQACETSRELLQGCWKKKLPTVQAKYAEFFAAHGFEEEASAVPSTPRGSTAQTRSATSWCTPTPESPEHTAA